MPPTRGVRNPGVAVERSDAPLRLFGFLAAGTIVFIALSFVAIMAIYPRSVTGPSDAPSRQTAAPRLQIDPHTDIAAYRAAETHELTSYGWVDRPHGIVRIPIDQAMHDIAASGIKDWPGDAR